MITITDASIKEYLSRNPALNHRAYQVETIRECLSLFARKENPYRSLMIESPTGSGKTVMGIITAAMLAEMLAPLLKKKPEQVRIGWVAMRKNLLQQAIGAAEAFGLGHLFVPISMFEKRPPKVDILVCDEAHHDATKSMATLHKAIKPFKVLGLSATPMRSDRAELIFEKQIAIAGIYELIRLNYLAKPDQYILPDWKVSSVCSAYLQEPKRWGKSILFFHTMEECQEALHTLRASGVLSEVVHGGLVGADRERILMDFEAGRTKVLINMAILTEGFDSPDLETVFVRPSNPLLTRQMAGRVLRRSPDPNMRKKVVQAAESMAPFSSLAPIGRSFKRKPDGDWLPLDYDADLITRLISQSNQKLTEHLEMVDQVTHDVLGFLSQDKIQAPDGPRRRAGGGAPAFSMMPRGR